MPLIKNGAFVEDDFVFVPEGQAFPDERGIIVTLERFQSEGETLLAHHARVGVRLSTGDNPDVLKAYLPKLAVIVLEFPVYKDGRHFSWARKLREQLGYKGEIRGSGHFLFDQIAFMMRVGFDAFEVRQDFRLEDYNRALGEMRHVYQPAMDGAKTIFDLRRGR